jgi:hypothetical protein
VLSSSEEAAAGGVVRREAAFGRPQPPAVLILEGDDLGAEQEHLVLDVAPPLAAMNGVVLQRDRGAAIGAGVILGLGVVGKQRSD